MNKILVPIQDFSPLSLAAAYFSVEFSKRNPTKILFLLFSPPPDREKADPTNAFRPLPKPFHDLVQQARAAKIPLDIFFSQEGFLETVSRFSKDHHISDIILAVPQEEDPRHATFKQQIEELRVRVESQVVVVRPKDIPFGEENKIQGKRSSGACPESPKNMIMEKERK